MTERKYGNRSGANVNPRRKLSASPEAWDLMDQCAGDESWNDWARAVLAAAVAQQLKLSAEDTAALFEREQ